LHRLKEYRFQRQRIIGSFIVDFYCPSARLVIELDGGQHYTGQRQTADFRRDEYLKVKGLRVLRFSDTDVLTNADAVVEEILRHVEQNPL
jgi:very-short-patch-repair endonuclease